MRYRKLQELVQGHRAIYEMAPAYAFNYYAYCLSELDGDFMAYFIFHILLFKIIFYFLPIITEIWFFKRCFAYFRFYVL